MLHFIVITAQAAIACSVSVFLLLLLGDYVFELVERRRLRRQFVEQIKRDAQAADELIMLTRHRPPPWQPTEPPGPLPPPPPHHEEEAP
jgi:hypothetical protein